MKMTLEIPPTSTLRDGRPAIGDRHRLSFDPDTRMPVVSCDTDAPASRMSIHELLALEEAALVEVDGE